MGDKSRIFCFSGTGNSLYAAKRLSAGLGCIPPEQITDAAPEGAAGGAGEAVGFVFPSYYGNLPRAVRAFINKLEIMPETYIFAVVTMGAVGQGSIGAADKALKAKGLRLNYGKGVRMPANYVISYNPADGNKQDALLDKTDGRLGAIANEISARVQSVSSMPITADNLYKDIEKLDAAFTSGGDCKGCGLCEKICPVRNIGMKNGKPEWRGRCERCMACISWCPSKAIDFGDKTRDRRRYRNPRITAEEMVRR